jgi:hypothetical protein
MIKVEWMDEAKTEALGLPSREYAALENVVIKLEELGDGLGFPHCSAVKGAGSLRELRPRRGRSPWRAFYARRGNSYFIIAAIGPEAQNNPRVFRRAVAVALERLERLESDHGND